MSPETTADEGFYAALPEITDFAEIADLGHYRDVPGSWHLVITDVKGSTAAIEAGRYKDVNAVGVASIIAMRNAVPDVEIPYVFGGDGATLLVPSTRLDACSAALRGARRLAREAFSLDLRAAVVPVAELRDEGRAVRLGRFRASPHVCLAMLAGDGLGAAEKRVKDEERGGHYAVSESGDETASFEGFECRWQPIESKRGRMASVLVVALPRDEGEAAAIYHDVIATIERIASTGHAHPATPDGLRLRAFGGDYSVEARVKSGSASGASFDGARRTAGKKARIGKVLIGLRASAGGFDGGAYRRELVENTDFRKFDATLRMVLDLSEKEVTELRRALTEEAERGKLAFGIHCSPSALVTCHVRSYAGDHVHFVDGSDGGYALAAKELKARLKRLG